MENMDGFMKYADYTNNDRPEETLAEALGIEVLDMVVPIKTYLSIADPRSPYLFYPPHCYKDGSSLSRGQPAFPMPVIAYVRTGN